MNEREGKILVGVCPHCGKQGVHQYRPFCSKRCADLDLGNWLGERYRIAGAALAGEDVGAAQASAEDATLDGGQADDA